MKALRILLGVLLFVPLLRPTASAQIQPDNFGWQCGPGSQTNCPISLVNGKYVVAWPTTPPMPNLLRLHDSITEWSEIVYQQESNSIVSGGCLTQCNWNDLDAYLDGIAAHPGTTAIETFASIPCWAAGFSLTNCPNKTNVYPHGTNYIPTDLASNPPGGSGFFNAFVTAFVQHCSPNLNCVGPCPHGVVCNATNLIQYFDLWNEWNMTGHWYQAAPPQGCGTTAAACAQLLYYMVAPAVAIIHQYIPNAIILMPSVTMGSPQTYQCDLAAWLNTENTNNNGTHISNVVNWHAYLTAGSGAATNTPEYQWNNFGKNFLAVHYLFDELRASDRAKLRHCWMVHDAVGRFRNQLHRQRGKLFLPDHNG